MSLALGRVTCTTYTCPDGAKADAAAQQAAILDVLAGAFTPIAPGSQVECSAGCCGFADPFAAPVAVILPDGATIFGFRIDTLKIPSSYLKAAVADAVKKRCAALGRAKLAKREVDLLKAEVKQELRAQSLPRMLHLQVVVDAGMSAIRVFTASPAALTILCDLWEKATGWQLRDTGDTRQAVDYLASIKADKYPDADRLHLDGMPSFGDFAPPSLGSEFLTWLWWRRERDDGTVGDCSIEFMKSLALERFAGLMTEKCTVSSEAEPTEEEARTALRMGKQVAKARLCLSTAENVFEVAVAADLSLSSIKLPQVAPPDDDTGEAAGEQAALLVDRLALLRECESAIAGLFGLFLVIRCDPAAWGAERKLLHKWIVEGA